MAKYYACDRCGKEKLSQSSIYRIKVATDLLDPVLISGEWEFCRKCAEEYIDLKWRAHES